jgi:hypothetical protein
MILCAKGGLICFGHDVQSVLIRGRFELKGLRCNIESADSFAQPQNLGLKGGWAAMSGQQLDRQSIGEERRPISQRRIQGTSLEDVSLDKNVL